MSTSRTIGRAAAVVSAGVLLSRVLGYGRNVLLASILGASTAADLYVAAFSVPDFLFFLMAGGYLSITLVPLLSGPLEDGDEDEARRTFTAVFRVVVGLMVVVTALLMVFAEPVTARLFPSFTDAQLARLTGMMRITFTSQVFFVAGTLLMAAQYARRRFLVPTLAPLLYNVGIIGGGLVGVLAGSPSPEAFIWGGLVGAAVGNFGVQVWGARAAGFRLVRGVPVRHAAVGAYFTLALPLMVGQSAVGLDEQWPRIFGQFAGDDAISLLYYARALNMLPVGVIAQAAGVAAFPFLAGLHAAGRASEMRATVLRSVRSTVAVGAAATALVLSLAVPLVRVAYERGSFDAADTRVASLLLLCYALSIPCWAAHQVYTRAFYAQRRMWLPVVIGTAVTAVVVPVLWVGVTTVGAVGVALGSTLGVAAYTTGVAVAWHREGSRAEVAELGRSLGRSAVAALACGAVTTAVARLLGAEEAATPMALLAGAVAGTTGGLAFLVTARWLDMAELDPVWSQLDRLRGSAAGG